MAKLLSWKSVHSTGFGACMFFKCEISNGYSYTIDIGPEIDEYRLHIVYKDGNYRALGQYTDFQTASYVANYHYQETNRHN